MPGELELALEELEAEMARWADWAERASCAAIEEGGAEAGPDPRSLARVRAALDLPRD